MAKQRKIYWDTVVFIDWLECIRGGRVAEIEPVIDAAYNQEILIVTSAFTMAEVVRLKGESAPRPEADDEKIRDFFRQPYIEVRNLDRAIAERARIICRAATETGKRMLPPDAVHVATALELGIYEMHTYDDDHLTPFSGKFGDDNFKLEICHPKYTPPADEPLTPTPTGQRGLFDDALNDRDDGKAEEAKPEDAGAGDADGADEGSHEEAAGGPQDGRRDETNATQEGADEPQDGELTAPPGTAEPQIGKSTSL